MDDFVIKPSQEGLVVRDPHTGKPLDANGETKPQSSYWLRRKAEGDIVIIAAEQSTNSEAA